jgi:hypothetical protein
VTGLLCRTFQVTPQHLFAISNSDEANPRYPFALTRQ